MHRALGTRNSSVSIVTNRLLDGEIGGRYLLQEQIQLLSSSETDYRTNAVFCGSRGLIPLT
jgi:hypothetical protein